MESLPRCTASVFVDRPIGSFAIDRITAEQVACFGKMDSDLVSPAGFELAFDQRVGADFFDRSYMGDRMLLGRIGCLDARWFRAAMTIPSVTDERALDGLLLGVTVNDCMVLTDHTMVLEGLDEGLRDTGGSGKEHQTRSVAIETVDCDDAESFEFVF